MKIVPMIVSTFMISFMRLLIGHVGLGEPVATLR